MPLLCRHSDVDSNLQINVKPSKTHNASLKETRLQSTDKTLPDLKHFFIIPKKENFLATNSDQNQKVKQKSLLERVGINRPPGCAFAAIYASQRVCSGIPRNGKKRLERFPEIRLQL